MELYTEIEIQATPVMVWEKLTDFESFSLWNPFITKITGDLASGAQLEVNLNPPGGKKMVFRPKVLKVESNYEIRWLGHFLLPGIFDGEHIFRIEPLGENRVRLVQSEIFSGILVPLFAKDLRTKVNQGFHSMNQALKRRAEQATSEVL
jgi:hypothetical protein